MDEDEERWIQVAQTELAQNVGGVWLCLGGAILFAAASLWFGVHSDMRQQKNWAPFIGGCSISLSLAYLSVMCWKTAKHDRRLLAQLQASRLNRAASKEPGVWPPPPSLPGR